VGQHLGSFWNSDAVAPKPKGSAASQVAAMVAFGSGALGEPAARVVFVIARTDRGNGGRMLAKCSGTEC
jgi:hypothetical protein